MKLSIPHLLIIAIQAEAAKLVTLFQHTLNTDCEYTSLTGFNQLDQALRAHQRNIILCDFALLSAAEAEAVVKRADVAVIFMADQPPLPMVVDLMRLGARGFVDRSDQHRLSELVQQELLHEVQAAKTAEMMSYRQVFDNNRAIKLLIDAKTGDIKDANPAAVAFYGYSLAQLKLMRIQQINILPEDMVFREMQRAASQERTFFEFRHRLASGEIRDVDVFSSTVDLPEGRYLYSIIVDVGNKREIAQRYRSLFEQSNDGVIIFDLEGRLLQANRRAAALLGYTLDEMVGLHCHDLMIPAQHLQHDALMHRIRAGEPISPYEMTLRCKDQTQLEVELNVELVHDGEHQPQHMQWLVRDITERKKMEANLHQSEERLRIIIENIPIMIGFFDRVGKFEFANKYWEQQLGWTVADLSHIENPLTAFYPDPVYRQQALDFMLSAEPGWRDFETHTKQQRVIATSWANVRLSDGRTIGFGQNITARKQMEAELRRSEEHLRLTLQGTQAGLWEWNVQTGETFFNERWAEIVGYTLEELAPVSIQTWINLAHPEDLARSNALLQRHFEGEIKYYDCEVRIRHKAGHWVWVLDRGMVTSRTADGQPLWMFGTHLDITDRKQMEEDLRQSEEKYRLIAENTSDGIISIDAVSGRITYASPAYDRQHGRITGTSVGLDVVSFSETIHPDDRDYLFKRFYEAIEQKAESHTSSYRSQRQDGHYFWREDHAKFNYAPDGTCLNMYVISRDITERKQAQQHEFELALEKARTRLLTQFIKNAAHEFRTPLSIINSSAYLLTRLGDEEQRQQKGERIALQVQRITDLVDDLLLISQLENQEILTFIPVDMKVLVEAECQRRGDEYGHQPQLQCHISADLPYIQGDVYYLNQAIRRLLDNAYRFTPPSGSITIAGGVLENQVWIEVSDTGSGILAEALPHIFETFWRQDVAHSTAGFGLGLPIVQRIIKHHGGTITVQSEVGQGSHFRIMLPQSI